MTPFLKSALRSLGLTGREFAALTGVSEDTVSGWGKKVRQSRGVQHEPLWAILLTDAWQRCPEALQAARAALVEASTSST